MKEIKIKHIEEVMLVAGKKIRGTKDHIVLEDLCQALQCGRSASQISLYLPLSLRWKEEVIWGGDVITVWLAEPEVLELLVDKILNGLPTKEEEQVSFLARWISDNTRRIDEELYRKRDWPVTKTMYSIYCKSADNNSSIGSVSLKRFIEHLTARGVKFYKNNSVCNIRLHIP